MAGAHVNAADRQRASFILPVCKIHDSLVAARTAGHRLAPGIGIRKENYKLRRTPGWNVTAPRSTNRTSTTIILRPSMRALRAASGKNRERVLPQCETN